MILWVERYLEEWIYVFKKQFPLIKSQTHFSSKIGSGHLFRLNPFYTTGIFLYPSETTRNLEVF